MQTDKGKLFHHLHHNGELLILPNIWNPLTAALLENLGYPAVATSSSAMSLSNGYRDGERLPFNELLNILKKITEFVKIPVTADVESGYAESNPDLYKNIKKLIDTGIAGINFEDSKHDKPGLMPIKEQCEKIMLIKKAAMKAGFPLFINARIDVYIKANHLSNEEKLTEAVMRGKAYRDAGADGIYPIILIDKQHIEAIVKEIGLPVNIMLQPGIPDFETLKEIGVARLSLGSGFLKTSIFAIKDIAEKLMKEEGMASAIQNMVSSDYLNCLIPNKPV